MQIKSLIVLLLSGCVVIATANAASPIVSNQSNNASKISADRAALLNKFLKSVGDSYKFKIVNDTDNNFTDFIIQSKTGEEIISPIPSDNFNCAAHTACIVELSSSKKSDCAENTTCLIKKISDKQKKGNWTFKFFENNKIVSAFRLSSPHYGWNTVTPNNDDLGIYAFKQIKSRFNKYKTLSDVGAKLDKINGKQPNYQNSHKEILKNLVSDMKASAVKDCNVSEDEYFAKFKPNKNAKGSLGNVSNANVNKK